MTRIGPIGAAILTWLVDHKHVTASDIGHACGMVTASAQGRLNFLKTQGLVMGELNDAEPPVRIYAITVEGRKMQR